MKKHLLKLTMCLSLLAIANAIHAQTWSLTGNGGTVDGFNFLGTTDNTPLNFRVNNTTAGRIDPTLRNTFFGFQSGLSNYAGFGNTATGYQALFSNSTGYYNLANGYKALSTVIHQELGMWL